jgi:hypothetical protein
VIFCQPSSRRHCFRRRALSQLLRFLACLDYNNPDCETKVRGCVICVSFVTQTVSLRAYDREGYSNKWLCHLICGRPLTLRQAFKGYEVVPSESGIGSVSLRRFASPSRPLRLTDKTNRKDRKGMRKGADFLLKLNQNP